VIPFPDSLYLAFGSPVLLLFLLLVPVAVVVYLWLERHREQKAARWASPALLPNMVGNGPGRLRHVPAILFGIAIVLLLVGFARPEAKFRTAKEGATVVLMVDISGSMAANDVNPTRLLAADAAITQFVNKMPSRYRAALVTFSNAIAVRVPPTYDHQALLKALPKKAQLEGTGIGDAVAEAVAVAKKAVGPSKPGQPHPPATILLVSDGGQNAGKVSPAAAAAQAKKAAIPVNTIAIGTASGKVTQRIPYNGRTVPFVQQVPVQSKTLVTLAKGSGGTYYAAHTANQASKVYKDLGSRLVYGQSTREITAGVTLAAFVLILAAAALSAIWFRRLV
jgi:Ca-activated chloride channel family protein